MSLPFFDAIEQYFPQSVIDIVAKETIKDLFLHHPAIHATHSFSKSHIRGLRGLLRYGQRLRQPQRSEMFFTLAPSFSSALMGYGTGSPIRIGYRGGGRSVLLTHSWPVPVGIHRVHLYCDLLRCFYHQWQQKGNVSSPVPSSETRKPQSIIFPFSEAEQRTPAFSRQPHTQYLVFNVNSEAQSRRLPHEKWIELANRLLADASQRRKILFIGMAAEQQRVQKVMQGIDRQDALSDLSGKTSLRDLAMVLRDADVVVTNDSGPMHLANAVGTPVVTFFGAGNPVETGPFNANNAVVLSTGLKCSPCVKNNCHFPTVRCLEQVTVDEIYDSVIRYVKNKANENSH